jgi:hypothetical protein
MSLQAAGLKMLQPLDALFTHSSRQKQTPAAFTHRLEAIAKKKMNERVSILLLQIFCDEICSLCFL